MQCTKPIRVQIKSKHGIPSWKYPDGLEVPCGKCLACRIQKRREWKLRMIHELSYHDDACFLTLTYSQVNLPPNASLLKRDLQLFFKRLRKELHPRKIKYFACGEYGDTNQRPHYHAIVFGLSLKPEDKKIVMKCWPYCDWSVYSIFMNSFGVAEPDSIGYVAQYIDKKFSGEVADNEYKSRNREPVFKLCSNGLGLAFVLDNHDTLVDSLSCTLDGKHFALPRYYIKKLGIDNAVNAAKSIERDCETVEHYTGLYMTSDDLYKAGLPKENEMLIEGRRRGKMQYERNLQARSNLFRSKKF